MRLPLALTAPVAALVGACAGSTSAPRLPDARPAPAAVRRLLRAIEDDISAVSHRFPELSRWHLRMADNMGFRYEFRCRAERHPSCMPLMRFARHGCLLSVNVHPPVRRTGPELMTLTPRSWISIREPIPDLDLVVEARLQMGETTSEGFVEAIKRIFTERIGALKTRRDDDPAAAAVGRMLQAIEDDISAVSHKYPELSVWHLREDDDMGLRYEFRYEGPRGKRDPEPRIGRHGCLLSVWVSRGLLDLDSMQRRAAPAEGSTRTWIFEPVADLDVTVQARIETARGTSEGFMAEMTRIVRKYLGALREESADRSTPAAPDGR